MIICKDLNENDTIGCIDEWYKKCPPARSGHWVDGRSAKTTAKIWLSGVPVEFNKLLEPLNFNATLCSPEFVSKLDNYDGNGRNHDLIVIDSLNKILVAVESKVDEPFGETIETQIKNAKHAFHKNPKSNALNRIRKLRLAVFGNEDDKQLELRYQLLHAVAGTVAEAAIQKYGKAVFMVQVFKTNAIDCEKHKRNNEDLDCFIKQLTHDKINSLKNGELAKIGFLPGNKFIPKDIELYIAKIEIRC